jgi:Fur family peroxide stress response transcriptional regulator
MRRNTQQRQAILDVLRGTTSHPAADWVYDMVRKVIPNISKGTVYRNLKILRDTGMISELNRSGTVSRFEARQDNHYHFRCEKCGRIYDLDVPVDTELDKRVAKKTGFAVSYHQTEFRGLCQDCQKKIEKGGERCQKRMIQKRNQLWLGAEAHRTGTGGRTS